MRVAVDKNNYYKIDNSIECEYIYVFDNESFEELKETGLHCIHKDYVKGVEINTTKFKLECVKKTTFEVENWFDIPPKKDYKFAVIVPNCNNDHGCYKEKTFFENCIESILNQSYKDLELIIVDDMSSDTSIDTVKKYMKKDERVHLIENKRKRYNGGSRNVAIDYCINNIDFDYFCFLDSDDWWVNDNVLENINNELYDHDLMLLGMELIDQNGVFMTKFHEYDCYEDFFLSDNKTWCTAWARVIKKEKIAYFCEDTLMEDRVWSYKQADNVDFDKVKNYKEICYVWNRTNNTNSVSMVRNGIWNASAYCHIGHQLQMLETLKHKEMIPIIKQRIEECKNKVNRNTYQQY